MLQFIVQTVFKNQSGSKENAGNKECEPKEVSKNTVEIKDNQKEDTKIIDEIKKVIKTEEIGNIRNDIQQFAKKQQSLLEQINEMRQEKTKELENTIEELKSKNAEQSEELTTLKEIIEKNETETKDFERKLQTMKLEMEELHKRNVGYQKIQGIQHQQIMQGKQIEEENIVLKMKVDELSNELEDVQHDYEKKIEILKEKMARKAKENTKDMYTSFNGLNNASKRRNYRKNRTLDDSLEEFEKSIALDTEDNSFEQIRDDSLELDA